jgi:hypothetical protein
VSNIALIAGVSDEYRSPVSADRIWLEHAATTAVSANTE